MTAINIFNTIRFDTTNQRMKNIADSQAVSQMSLNWVALYMRVVQFSLEKIWYMPRKEFHMSKNVTPTTCPPASTDGKSPLNNWEARMAARKVNRNTKMIKLRRPTMLPNTTMTSSLVTLTAKTTR